MILGVENEFKIPRILGAYRRMIARGSLNTEIFQAIREYRIHNGIPISNMNMYFLDLVDVGSERVTYKELEIYAFLLAQYLDYNPKVFFDSVTYHARNLEFNEESGKLDVQVLDVLAGITSEMRRI